MIKPARCSHETSPHCPCMRSRNQRRDASSRHGRPQEKFLPTMRLNSIIVHDHCSCCSDAHYFSFSHRRLFSTTLHRTCRSRLVRADLVGCPHDNPAWRHSPHFCCQLRGWKSPEASMHPLAKTNVVMSPSSPKTSLSGHRAYAVRV